MKIFISHTAADKSVVEPAALALSRVFGRDNVFYDSWSIQPGDGIIDKMNSGLEDCDCFFLFVSERSLTSEMVKMEWQNALMIHAKRGMRFVPVLLDDCKVPAIFLQKRYIDAFRTGMDVAIRQMIDVASGANIYHEEDATFQNLKAYARLSKGSGVDIEVRAEMMMEPISEYAVVLESDSASVTCPGEVFYRSGKGRPIENDRGMKCIPYIVAIDRPTVKGFPFRIRVEDEAPISVQGVFHAAGEGRFERVPVVVVMSDDVFHFGADIEVPLDEVCAPGITQEDQLAALYKIMSEALSQSEPHGESRRNGSA